MLKYLCGLLLRFRILKFDYQECPDLQILSWSIWNHFKSVLIGCNDRLSFAKV